MKRLNLYGTGPMKVKCWVVVGGRVGLRKWVSSVRASRGGPIGLITTAELIEAATCYRHRQARLSSYSYWSTRLPSSNDHAGAQQSIHLPSSDILQFIRIVFQRNLLYRGHRVLLRKSSDLRVSTKPEGVGWDSLVEGPRLAIECSILVSG